MKICVYAISKNEAKFVTRWMASMREADEIHVLDTGSTDDTVRLLREAGAHVAVRTFDPWRFDVARNASMEMVPQDADILVCADLDEVFTPGWRRALENAWAPGTTRAKYKFVWNHTPDGGEGVSFLSDKIHARRGYRWAGAVHEVLAAPADERCVTVNDMQLDHYADDTKPRSSYLPLLEMAVQEDPNNDRNMHYLGREYMFYGQHEKAIETLQRHIGMPTATWDAERAASMRFIARCKVQLHDLDAAELWYARAIAEAPQYREAWVEMARLMYDQQRWRQCIYYAERGLAISERPLTYICEPEAWGAQADDLLCIAYWHIGMADLSMTHALAAVKKEPGNPRLQNNVRILKLSNRPGGAK